ncbi:hypothetical protein [Falsirhodobacter sp. 20TX0035]|uniref:hypothetical protein n=1 Tax=Falsirhodobacter sp. 20TX0035 TaxID=3022019 RepID=UPI00232D3F42|nr:hypothetical protein [Falsirhodobacter sp. 20TX0035]MDB6453564.1 hypothetical protein [Falsirhodobacter sp. 20TX0035]
MPLATQLSRAPTNKLMAGGISAAVITSAWSEVFAFWPPISGPGMSTLAGILIAMAIGYFVPDRANLPVT